MLVNLLLWERDSSVSENSFVAEEKPEEGMEGLFDGPTVVHLEVIRREGATVVGSAPAKPFFAADTFFG